MDTALTQWLAVCFAAGVVGALAVVLCSHILFALGLGQKLGAQAPISFEPPEIYRPLFWGGLWGIPFGLAMHASSTHLLLVGALYFLVPVLALFLIFLPRSGAGLFGLKKGGPRFTAYLLLVNLPYGVVTALVAKLISVPA